MRHPQLSRRVMLLPAAVLLAGGMSAALPGTGYAADGAGPAPVIATPSGPSAQVRGDGCKGVNPAVLPATGNITDIGGTEGGELWTAQPGAAPAAGGTCLGTVIEDVSYPAAGTMDWRVIVFDAADEGGLTVAERPFTETQPGDYTTAFGIHGQFPGLTQVCVTATSTAGPAALSCVTAGGPPPVPQQFTQQGDTAPAPSGW